MSGSAKQWVIVIVFFVSFFVATLVEAKLLNKATATALTRAFAAAFIPNIFTVTVGFAFSAVMFGLVLMFVTNDDPNAGLGENTVRAGVALALLAPLAVLFLAKRLTLMVFRLEMNRNAWLYSFIASLLFLIAVVLPTMAVAYFI